MEVGSYGGTEIERLWAAYFRHDKPDQLRNDIATHYLDFVRQVARKFANQERSFDECFSAGSVGLLKAIPCFKPERNTKPEAYFWHYIRGEILNQSHQLRGVSRDQLSKFYRLKEAGIRCPDEAAELLGCTPRRAAMILATSKPRSLDAPIGDEECTLADTLAERSERKVAPDITPLLSQCSEIERRLLELYYFEHLSMAKVGEKLGVSKTTVGKMHKALLAKLAGIEGCKPLETSTPKKTTNRSAKKDPVKSAIDFLSGGQSSIDDLDAAIEELNHQIEAVQKSKQRLMMMRDIVVGLKDKPDGVVMILDAH